MAGGQSYINIQMSESSTNGIPSTKLSPELENEGGSTLTFHNISYSVKVKSGFLCCRKTASKEVLRDLNGIMRPGLNAILGPTGSGKSSLLDILAARKDPHGLSGDILINGAPQPANFKCTSGYVVQVGQLREMAAVLQVHSSHLHLPRDDVVMGTLTIRENFQFSAALRLPNSVKEQDRNERVNQIIKELGLSKVADSKVGTQFTRGVSGGERKRTNIGMELITDPTILFLDEPTTGLDASTANAVLLLLKRMAKQGKTIIFSIHQPRYSIFRLFDSLTLLAAGRMLYHGPAQQTITYFQSIGYECEPYNNPADFFLDIINGDSTAVMVNKTDEDNSAESVEEHIEYSTTLAEKLAEKYCNSTYYQETKAILENISLGNTKKTKAFFRQITYTNSFCHQLKWVSRRTFKNLVGNPQASIAQVVVTVFLGLVVGAIFFGLKNDTAGLQNRVGAMFFLTTNQCFSSISAIELFVVEKKIFTHEYISGYYGTAAYFISKLMADLIPIRTLPSIIFTCITYFMLGKFEADSRSLLYNAVYPYDGVLHSHFHGSSHRNRTRRGRCSQPIHDYHICFYDYFLWVAGKSHEHHVLAFLAQALQINELSGLDFCTNNTGFPGMDNSQLIVPMWCTGDQYLKSQGIDVSTWGLWQNHVALACMTCKKMEPGTICRAAHD
ncbi:ATP-binding cassette sub-family G member 2 isoform X4 [Aix galericulata]|nr:ATP-binding cassette sub-family G member 2 isoform X4 [Aix galericulata]